MKNIPTPGEQRIYRKVISETDLATFHGELLHPVYSTFALARDFEWSSRLFFLEMKEEDEEGVGTHVNIAHKSPAFVGEEVIVTATVQHCEGPNLHCEIVARVGSRVIAEGTTGQRMLKKDILKQIFTPPAHG